MNKQVLILPIFALLASTAIFAQYHAGDVRRLTASANGASSATSTGAATSSVPTLVDVLQHLQDQQLALISQMTDIRAELEVTKLRTVFTRDLRRGDSGDDVSQLQELIAKVSGNASSTISGTFGRLTEKALIDFQTREGLKKTGILDKNTRNRLFDAVKDIFAESSSTEPAVQDFSFLSSQPNPQDIQDQVAGLTSQLSGVETIVAGFQDQLLQLTSDLSEVAANTQVLPTEPPPPPPPPPPPSAPATQPLVISNITSSSTKNAATITWITNDPATSEVDYSQNSGFPKNQTVTVSNPAIITAHSLSLTSLNPGTTYYYHAVSKDGASTATSSNLSFSTVH